MILKSLTCSIDMKMKRRDVILDSILFSLIAFYLVISPYTKVEESFNIQAIHDIYNYGIYPREKVEESFDHINFPGVVPRSFIGALVIAGISKMVGWLVGVGIVDTRSSQKHLLMLSRGVLGTLNGLSLISIRRSIDNISYRDKGAKKDGLTGTWYTLLLASQFHILYYASRTLPNFIALPLVNYSISLMLEGNIMALALLAFTGIVFRLEIGVFAVIIALVTSIFHGPRTLIQSVVSLTTGTILGLVTTFSVDSYFWGSLIVPELASFYFNVVKGRAAEWGTEPWSAYFKKYLLQIFRPPTVLTLLFPGCLSDPSEKELLKQRSAAEKNSSILKFPERGSLRILLASSVLYIATLSFQSHKEWRFIIYVAPILTLVAANGLSIISRRADTSRKLRILTSLYSILILLGVVISILMGVISSFNYPGGEAIQYVNDYVLENSPHQNTTVHMDVAACMTGINRFCELHNSSLNYDKTESEIQFRQLIRKIDILISDDILENKPILAESKWKLLKVIYAFQGISVKPIIEVFRTKIMLAYRMQIRKLTEEILENLYTSPKDILLSMIVRRKFLHVYKKVAD